MANEDNNIWSSIDLYYVHPRYAGLANIGLQKFESSTIWKDANLRSEQRVKMVRIMSLRDEEGRSKILSSAIDCLCKSVSRFSVGCLIIAAWNLISPQDSTKYVFEVNEVDDPTCEIDVSELSTEVLAKAPEGAVRCNLPTNPCKKLKAVAYLAASALRMITKSSESRKLYQSLWKFQISVSEILWGGFSRRDSAQPKLCCWDKVVIRPSTVEELSDPISLLFSWLEWFKQGYLQEAL